MPRNKFNDTLHWAICVPSTCSSDDVGQFLNIIFSELIAHHEVDVSISENMCSTTESKPLTSLDIIFGCVLINVN